MTATVRKRLIREIEAALKEEPYDLVDLLLMRRDVEALLAVLRGTGAAS